MKFSELFNLGNCHDEEWFDSILSVDTRLFIDPFLLYDQESGIFEGSHREIIDFFNTEFHILATTRGNRHSNLWKKVEADFVLPEVEELCLGYTGAGTARSGAGRKLARLVTEAMWEAIEAGITEIRHFEEIALIRESIGADRISDITASILRYRFAEYTFSVSQRFAISLETVRYIQGRFDSGDKRWKPIEVHLPRNPYNNKPILLCPRKYLRHLPTIEPDDFWEYCYYNENDILRARYGEDVSRRVDKHSIVEIARENPDARKRYIDYREKEGSVAYNFLRDPSGLYGWYDETKKFCDGNPITLNFNTDESFQAFVLELIETFKHYVEENRGWALLWNDSKTPRKELACQDLFLGVVKHYCKANDVDISKEPNIGRGPVDFKVSSGFKRRALIEVKKADNTKFWNGLTKQLPTYQRAEEVRVGYFLVMLFSEKDFERINEIQKVINKLNESLPYEVISVIVHATYNKPSASRL